MPATGQRISSIRRSEGSRTIHGTLTPKRPPRRSRTLLRARVHPASARKPLWQRYGTPSLHFSVVGALLGLVVLVGAFPVQVTDVTSNPILNVQRVTLPGLAAAVPTAGAQALTAGPVPLTVIAGNAIFDDVLNATNNTSDEQASMLAAQQSSSTPLQAIENEANEKIPIFWEYEVEAGDTLGSIAERFDVDVDYIVWNNAEVKNANDISPGQILQIPSIEGIIHSVRTNETVTEIAERYEADWRDIIDFRANALSDPNAITPGTQILVPGGIIPAPVVPVPPPVRPGTTTPSDSIWAWPVVNGLLTSPFGPTHPLGIDLAATFGTPVRAAASGTVTFVGGNRCCSYGAHVIIDHGNGYETLYAHFDSFSVDNGQSVAAGDIIGTIGLTGTTTGPHVHFELRRHGQHQDPLWYLP
ncbi:MAG: peptidoglycan DD-metalloendopeptidase family protein [Dehalococcoidia bacterium]